MSEAIRIQYTPCPSDYVRVMRAHTVRTRAVWLSLAGLAAVVVFAVWSFGSRGQWSDPVLWLIVVGAPILALGALFVWQPMRVKNQVKRQERFRSETTWQVDDTQVVLKNPYSEIKLDWAAFQAVMETRDDFILIHAANKRMLEFLPKRAFASAEQLAAFRSLVGGKLKTVRWT